MMKDSSQRPAQITADDRAWFLTHPEAVVRFRPIRAYELESLKMHGIRPPEFRPSWCKSSAAVEQFAVIDLTRLLQSSRTDIPGKETIRIRIATPKTRGKSAKLALQNELTKAICQELLILVKQEAISSPVAREHERETLVA